jgi:hypothetical protein
MHPELITKDINSRSTVMFFNSISSLPSFESNLPLIQMIGEGSVGLEFSTLFTMFINNKLDKIISPKDILFHNSEEYVMNTLKGVIGKGKDYRADIASTIATRIVNYSLFVAEDTKVEKSTIDRISKLITEDVFSNDIKYQVVKQIYNGNPSKFKLMTLNKDLIKFVMK